MFKYPVNYFYKKGVLDIKMSFNIDKKYLKLITTDSTKQRLYEIYSRIIENQKLAAQEMKDHLGGIVHIDLPHGL